MEIRSTKIPSHGDPVYQDPSHGDLRADTGDMVGHEGMWGDVGGRRRVRNLTRGHGGTQEDFGGLRDLLRGHLGTWGA